MPRWRQYRGDDGIEHPVVGTLKIAESVFSPQLGNRRDLLVYLPPSYAALPLRRYPVIYMHDGQNLFDRATSFAGEWRVGETLEAMSAEGLEAIVVGVSNAGNERCDEYSPWVDSKAGGGRGDLYLRFLTDTVKPLIDCDFRTLPLRDDTAIVGSSMGGLISLYAFFRHPGTFGSAGVMSPALWFANGAIFRFLKAAPLFPGRLYLDVGTREGAGEVRDVWRLYRLLRRKGFRRSELRLLVERGGQHREVAWARRLPGELRFLMGLKATDATRPASRERDRPDGVRLKSR